MINTNYLINGTDLGENYFTIAEYIQNYDQIKPDLRYSQQYYKYATNAAPIPNRWQPSIQFTRYQFAARDWKYIVTNMSSTSTPFVAIMKTDNSLWSWGNNDTGQLGQGDYMSRSTPTQIGTDLDWKYIVKNPRSDSVLAIKQDGTLWGWGDNAGGRLGDPSLTLAAYTTPVQIGTRTNWKQFLDCNTLLDENNQVSMFTQTSIAEWNIVQLMDDSTSYIAASAMYYGDEGAYVVDSTNSLSFITISAKIQRPNWNFTNWIDVINGPYNNYFCALSATGELWKLSPDDPFDAVKIADNIVRFQNIEARNGQSGIFAIDITGQLYNYASFYTTPHTPIDYDNLVKLDNSIGWKYVNDHNATQGFLIATKDEMDYNE